MCVCVCRGGGGWLVKWFRHWAQDPWVMGSSPTNHRCMDIVQSFSSTPTSPPSCEWVPGVSWGANHGSSLNSSGPGGSVCVWEGGWGGSSCDPPFQLLHRQDLVCGPLHAWLACYNLFQCCPFCFITYALL